MEWAVLFVENKNCQLTNFRKLKKFAAVVETEKTVPRFSNNLWNIFWPSRDFVGKRRATLTLIRGQLS